MVQNKLSNWAFLTLELMNQMPHSKKELNITHSKKELNITLLTYCKKGDTVL